MWAKIKMGIGHLLVVLLPRKAKTLAQTGITLNFQLNRIERLMKNAMLHTAEKQGGYANLAELHKNNWMHQGKHFFELTDARFQNNFLPKASFVFDILKNNISSNEHEFSALVEIGTGSGSVLNYLSGKFPRIQKFIGIDLSLEQVAINNKKFEGSKMEFVASDGYDWIMKHAQSNMIFVTYGGVLEYFTEQRISELLSHINKLRNIIFVAIEPVGADHDFNVTPHTQLYGSERSFSHNYPRLFKEAGFNLWHESTGELIDEGYRFIFLGAEC